MKICPKCGREYSIVKQCPNCNKIRQSKWRLENPEAKSASNKRWSEKNAEAKRAHNAQFQREHPELTRARVAKYSQAHPEKVKARSCKRRAIKNSAVGSHNAKDILEQLQRQHNKCYYCGEKLDKYHVDHVVPLSRGGSNGPDNLVIACPSCNLGKNDKLPHEWPEGGRLL